MKVLYIPKFKKDKAPFYISKIVHAIVSNIDNSIILLSPGYLSVSNKSLKNFIDEIFLNCDSTNKIGIFNGMNGSTSIRNSQGKFVLLEHINYLKKLNKNTLNLVEKNLSDHRKMIFFTKRKNKNSYVSLSANNLDKFMTDHDCIAVLLGSSNQSNTSYFGVINKKSLIADKGESDILLYNDDDILKSLTSDDLNLGKDKGCILTTSEIDKFNNCNIVFDVNYEQKYLNNILYNFLINNLK